MDTNYDFSFFKKGIHLLPGAAHALTVTFVGYPFDTTKTRLQADKENKLYRNAWDCVQKVVKNEGVNGLYRGVSSPLFSHMIKRPYQFPIFEYLKNQGMNGYIAGALSGAAGTLVGVPLQTIKVNMQSDTRFKNAWDFTKWNFNNHGISGFYRGFLITGIKDTVFGATFLGTYSTLRTLVGNDNFYQKFLNGAVAHATSWLFFMPIDYIKTQVQNHKGKEKLKIMDVVKTARAEGGLGVMWRGVIPAVLRTVPVSGFGMIAYEEAKAFTESLDK